jgi:hypothetical protein
MNDPFVKSLQRQPVFRETAGEFPKDPAYLSLKPPFLNKDAVVLFHDILGLYKQGLPGGRNLMNDSPDTAPEVGFQGQNHTAVPLGRYCRLEHTPGILIVGVTQYRSLKVSFQGLNLPFYIPEFREVPELAVPVQDPEHILRQGGTAGDIPGQSTKRIAGQGRRRTEPLFEFFPPFYEYAQGIGFVLLQDHPLNLQLREDGGYVRKAPALFLVPGIKAIQDAGNQDFQFPDRTRIAKGKVRSNNPGRFFAQGAGGNTGTDSVKFQEAQGLFIHS